MNYKIQEESYGAPNQVILVRSSFGLYLGAAIFLLVGLSSFAVGLLAWLAKPEPFSFGLLGFGVAFSGGGFLFLSLSWPKRFIFDNEMGALFVEEKGQRGIVKTPLPYDEIEGFQVRMYVVSSSSGSHGSRHQPRYAVDLIKSDGAFWMLHSSGSEVKAQEVMRELVERVDLERSFSGDPLEQKPPQFSITEKGDHTEIRWKRNSEWPKILSAFLMVTGFGILFFGFGQKLPSILHWIAGGFLGLVGFTILYNSIANIGKYQILKISGHHVEALQTGLPIAGANFSMRTHEIKSIQFNFSLREQQQVLYFLREDELEVFAKGKRGELGVGDLLSFAQVLLRVRKLQMPGCTVGEMLYIEHLIQDLIFERTGQAPE